MSVKLSEVHRETANRQRRIIFQDDVLANDAFRTDAVGPTRLSQVIDFYMSRLDAAPNQIDSVWHEWGEGNTAVWPSEVLPTTDSVFPLWWDIGIDPVRVLLEETRKRGREVFFSYRINGSDNDDLFDPPHLLEDPIPLKAEHPDWLIHKWHVYWNFASEEVRELKLAAISEVAEHYDYDGISIDFARIPVLFPEGEQWRHRDVLTDFMQQVRATLHRIAALRGRPYLLAARVAEDIPGCHYDGMDVETWVREELVDILVVGTRTARADIPSYRALTQSTPIKIYPSWDDHHSSDGYRHPSVEVWRGVCANWWRHRPDGIHTFNLMLPSPESEHALGIAPTLRHRGGSGDSNDILSEWETQCHVFNEIGSSETLVKRDKIFYVERRGGGHGSDFIPAADDWYTPRHAYFQTNMLAPLPVDLLSDGSADTMLTLDVADDIRTLSNALQSLTLRLALTGDIEAGTSIEIEVRINNLLLSDAWPETGVETPLNVTYQHWMAFSVTSQCLAVGSNLIGIRMAKPIPSVLCVEKVELHVRYQ